MGASLLQVKILLNNMIDPLLKTRQGIQPLTQNKKKGTLKGDNHIMSPSLVVVFNDFLVFGCIQTVWFDSFHPRYLYGNHDTYAEKMVHDDKNKNTNTNTLNHSFLHVILVIGGDGGGGNILVQTCLSG